MKTQRTIFCEENRRIKKIIAREKLGRAVKSWLDYFSAWSAENTFNLAGAATAAVQDKYCFDQSSARVLTREIWGDHARVLESADFRIRKIRATLRRISTFELVGKPDVFARFEHEIVLKLRCKKCGREVKLSLPTLSNTARFGIVRCCACGSQNTKTTTQKNDTNTKNTSRS